LAIVCGIGRIAPDARRKAVNNPQRGQKTDPNTVSSLKKGNAPENAHRQQTMAEGIKRFLSSLLERVQPQLSFSEDGCTNPELCHAQK
jgi:hypothetical protein